MELSRNRRIRYDDDLRGLVAAMCSLKTKNQLIATEFGVSLKLVQRYRRNLQAFGEHLPQSISYRGPKPRIVRAV